MNNHPRDLLRLASAFTPRRAFNAARVLANYQASRLTGKVVAPPFPISLAIEPTTSCNLRCPECPSGLRSFTRPTGMLDPDFLRSVIDQVHRDVAYLVFYFQGEPFLHPQLLHVSHKPLVSLAQHATQGLVGVLQALVGLTGLELVEIEFQVLDVADNGLPGQG